MTKQNTVKSVSMKDIKLVYTSPAYPICGIKLDETYSLKNVEDKYYIYNQNLEQELDLELIKCLFTPKNISWKDINLL